MSEQWARLMLATYRWVGSCAYPIIGPYLAYRAAQGKEDHKRRLERYGKTLLERPKGALIWVHAASVGETNAVIPLIKAISAKNITIVLTTGTITSAKIAQERIGTHAIHQYVPLDFKPAVSNFLNHWKPDLALIAESEIWPMTLLELGKRRIPQILVNGRLSDKSFAAWQKRCHLAEALFENLSHVIAQSEIDAERFSALGARPVSVSGNLKGDMEPLPADPAQVELLKRQIGSRPVWAALSTHDGEEESAAHVHKMVVTRHPGLLTLIVPRHPNRAGEIAEMLRAQGLRVARRSLKENINRSIQVYIADTIGEMGIFLRLTEIAFVGRSLNASGGQNPIEPAALGTAVLSGPHIQNFRDSYKKLIADGAARLVKDKDMLAGAVSYLLANESVRHRMCAAGVSSVEDLHGSLNTTLTLLEPFIQPLVVKMGLERSMDNPDDA